MSDWNEAIDSAIEEVRRAVRACHELDRTGLALDAMDALEENIRSLKRPAPLDGGWMPIESAPKEGVAVILAAPCELCSNGWAIGEAKFNAETGDDGAWWWGDENAGDYHAQSLEEQGLYPKFWQPLPCPPGGKNGD